VLTQCFEIFATWDDEYDKLQGLLRDIVKKKRDENVKMVWRVHPSHKKLQSRMENMRKFRRQHDQVLFWRFYRYRSIYRCTTRREKFKIKLCSGSGVVLKLYKNIRYLETEELREERLETCGVGYGFSAIETIFIFYRDLHDYHNHRRQLDKISLSTKLNHYSNWNSSSFPFFLFFATDVYIHNWQKSWNT